MKNRSSLPIVGLAVAALLGSGCSKKDETATQLSETTGSPAAASGPAAESSKDDWAWADSASTGASGPAIVAVTEPEQEPSQPIELSEEPPAPAAPRPSKPKPPAARPAPAPEREPEAAPAPEPAPAPKPEPVKVTYAAPAGTSLGFQLDQPLSSATSQVGETFTGTLSADVTDGRGRVVLPAGTRVLGKVTQAVPAKKAEKKSFLAYSLEQAQLPDGTLVAIAAGQRLEGKGWTKKDGAIIGGSAGGGALAGGVIGGDAKGAAIGAVLGAAIGSGVALSKKGEDVTVNAGETITVPLDAEVVVERIEMVMPVATSN